MINIEAWTNLYACETIISTLFGIMWEARQSGSDVEDVLASLYEVLFFQDKDVFTISLDQLKSIDPSKGSLLRRAIVQKTLLVAALENKINEFEPIISCIASDVDTSFACVGYIQEVWSPHGRVSRRSFEDVIRLYSSTYEQTASPQVRAASTEAIADILASTNLARDGSFDTSWLHQTPHTPQELHANIRLSGSILAYSWFGKPRTEGLEQSLRRWAWTITNAGTSDQACYTA